MTVVPENRFRCNRCGDEALLPIQNTAMPRPVPPEGWAVLTINKLDTQLHLCPPCAFGLSAYMDGASISSNVGEPYGSGPAVPA